MTRDPTTVNEVLIAKVMLASLMHYGKFGIQDLIHPSTQLILFSGPENRVTVIKG